MTSERTRFGFVNPSCIQRHDTLIRPLCFVNMTVIKFNQVIWSDSWKRFPSLNSFSRVCGSILLQKLIRRTDELEYTVYHTFFVISSAHLLYITALLILLLFEDDLKYLFPEH